MSSGIIMGEQNTEGREKWGAVGHYTKAELDPEMWQNSDVTERVQHSKPRNIPKHFNCTQRRSVGARSFGVTYRLCLHIRCSGNVFTEPLPSNEAA
jgi:hypothetical protein